MTDRARFEIRLLGRFVVLRDGREIPASEFGGRLPRTLIRILAGGRGRFFPKDALAEALWHDHPPADPAGNLEILVSRARRGLGDPDLIVTGPNGYALAADERCALDIDTVREHVTQGRTLREADDLAAASEAFRRAVDAWGGEPLPEDAYAGWADELRAELRRLHLEALEGAAESALAIGQPAQAVQMAEMALVREPLRERTNVLLVRALAAAGDRAAAVAAYGSFRERFAEELGLDPSAEAEDLHRSLLRGELEQEFRDLHRLADAGGPAEPDLRGTLGGTEAGPARARALAAMASLAAGSDDYERGGRLAEFALLEAGDDGGARAEALLAAAIVDMNLGLLERSESRLDEALELYERLGQRHGVARVVDVRAMETFLAGHVREGVRRFEEVATAFEELGDLVRVVTPRSTLGHGLVFMDRPGDGLPHIERALELSRELEDEEAESYCLWHRSEALSALGRADEALASANGAFGIAERRHHREWSATSLRGLGIASLAAGDLASAEAAFRRSFELAEGLPVFRSFAASRLALVQVGSGRLEEAAPLVDLALEVGTPLSMFEARLALAELAAAQGRADAPAIAAEALSIAEREGFLQGADRLRELSADARPAR